MQTLTKQQYLDGESTQAEDWKPAKEDIKKFVYSPYGDSENSEFVENNNPISLEELQAEERKTKRPTHQRPLTKTFIVGLTLIPFFAFIYMFMGGTKKPAQIAKAIQETNTKDKELVAQNQQLQQEIDQMELELAKLKQEKETPPPKPKTQPAVKVAQPPPPKPKQKPVTPVRTVAARRPSPPPRRTVRQTTPTPKPTAEDLMRRRQLLAQSVVFGGSMGNTEESLTPVQGSEYEPEIASNSTTPNPNVTLVSSRNQPNQALLMANVNAPAAQEPIDFSIGGGGDSRTPSIQKQFTPGTSISAESLHPAFFSSGQSARLNVRVTNSNTPLPEGTNLSVELQEINGALSVTAIQAEVNNQVQDLQASNWQVTGEDGMPLIATPVEESNSNNGQAWKYAAGTVLRNTSRVYRSDDFLTSTLIGVGSSLAQGQLNRGGSRTSQSNQSSNIRVIEQNTPLKLYVIQGFGL